MQPDTKDAGTFRRAHGTFVPQFVQNLPVAGSGFPQCVQNFGRPADG